jgi:4-carboxymuconolactone decarboxylase
MAQKKPTVYEFVPKLGQLRDDVLFGDVWEHPDLSKRDRSLITVAMLAALYRTDEMRGPHAEGARQRGDGDRVEGADHVFGPK